MDSRRTIEELLGLVRADPTDVRSRLKLGDVYARSGDVPSALQQYEWVAKYYAHIGFALKAVAVYKQICVMVARDAPELRPRYAHVPAALADVFRQLGLEGDAVRALDALGPDVSSGRHGPS